MNRRNLLKGLLGLPFVSLIPSKMVPGEWIDVSSAYLASSFDVGTVFRLRVEPTFGLEDIGNNMVRLVSPYKNFMIVDKRLSDMKIKVVPV